MSDVDGVVGIYVPRQGWETQDVTLSTWLVPDGSSVDEGDPVCEIETDKVTAELEAPAAGILRHIGQVETVYDVGACIGEIRP